MLNLVQLASAQFFYTQDSHQFPPVALFVVLRIEPSKVERRSFDLSVVCVCVSVRFLLLVSCLDPCTILGRVQFCVLISFYPMRMCLYMSLHKNGSMSFWEGPSFWKTCWLPGLFPKICSV